MRKLLLAGGACVVFVSVSSGLPAPETAEAKALSNLRERAVFLCGFATIFHRSPKLESTWKALEDPELKTENLIPLLHSPDPKIRSLAIFALDHKEDPRVLPEIASLESDRAASYPWPMPVNSALSGQSRKVAGRGKHGRRPGNRGRQGLHW